MSTFSAGLFGTINRSFILFLRQGIVKGVPPRKGDRPMPEDVLLKNAERKENTPSGDRVEKNVSGQLFPNNHLTLSQSNGK
jgi:hypothetical protein